MLRGIALRSKRTYSGNERLKTHLISREDGLTFNPRNGNATNRHSDRGEGQSTHRRNFISETSAPTPCDIYASLCAPSILLASMWYHRRTHAPCSCLPRAKLGETLSKPYSKTHLRTSSTVPSLHMRSIAATAQPWRRASPL